MIRAFTLTALVSTLAAGCLARGLNPSDDPNRPAPVNNARASAGDRWVRLSWGEAARADKYTVIRAENPAGPWTLRALSPSTTYTDRGVKNGVSYFYAVRAMHGGAVSDFGRQAKATPMDARQRAQKAAARPQPGAPLNVTARSLNPRTIRVSWNHANQPRLGYEVEWRLGTKGDFSPMATLSANDQFYDDQDVVAGTVNYYRVRSTGSAGASPYSEEVSATAGTLPPPGSMALVQAGCFTMGYEGPGAARDQQPAHEVCLVQFLIDVFEVANWQYAACVKAEACSAPRPAKKGEGSGHYGEAPFARYPVVNVTSAQAGAYCAWMNKRLPTEAEWESAARGGAAGRRYPWGDTPECKSANFAANGRPCDKGPTWVGRYPPNDFGLYDMSGNVSEWTSDWYGESYYRESPVYSPAGPQTGTARVRRGGSWASRADEATVDVRASTNGDASSQLGFRCAR